MLWKLVQPFSSNTIHSFGTNGPVTSLGLPTEIALEFQGLKKHFSIKFLVILSGIYLQKWNIWVNIRVNLYNLVFRAINGFHCEFEKLFLDLLSREVIIGGNSVHENFSGFVSKTLSSDLKVGSFIPDVYFRINETKFYKTLIISNTLLNIPLILVQIY